MAKLPRVLQKLFGSTGVATDFGKFGSLAAGSPVTTKDPDTIQELSEFEEGWEGAIIASNRPAKEDRNGLDLLWSYQISYIFQEGIPEYLSTKEYHQFSVVKKTGTFELYGSLTNTNTGNALPSQTDNANWKYLGSLENLKKTTFIVGQRVELDYEPSGGDLTTNRLLFSDGSAVSRATYADLFAKLGVIHGQGDGATTFNLPDYRGRFARGWDDGAGVDPDAGSRGADATGGVTGDNVGSVQDDEFESHHHAQNNDTVYTDGAIGSGTSAPLSPDNPQDTEDTGGNETRPKNKYTWVGIAY